MKLLHRSLRSLGLHLQRWHDPYQDVQTYLPAGAVSHIVDGGAYDGGVSSRLALMFPSATVHSFEPQPQLFAAISRRFTGQERVRPYQLALSDRMGESTFYVNEQAFTSSLLTTLEPAAMKPACAVTVRRTTLDEWAKGEGVAAPDFIKLDLQGHELAALRGAQRLLQTAVKALLVEVNFVPRYSGCCLFHEVANYICEFDFRLVRLYEIINDASGAWKQADALFVHRSAYES